MLDHNGFDECFRAEGIVSLHRPRRGYRVVGSFLRGRSRVPLDATLGAALTRYNHCGRTLLAATLLASSVASCGYNRLQELDEHARGARSEIEIQLQRRVDLVPNLIQTLRGYASLDDEVVTEVADARARLARVVRSGELSSMEEGNTELTGAVTRLMESVVEYPALRADAGFRLLRSQLEEIEESIVAAGQAYNEAVQQYNAYIKGFPQVMTAKLIGAEELRSFEIRDSPAIVKAAGE